MPETYNFQENDAATYFNFLMLEGETTALTQRDDFDSKNLSVILKINGVDVRIGDFNAVLKKWGERIERQIKESAHFANFDAAVDKRARQLIQQKLGNTMEVLDDIEHSLWKLDMPD